MYKLNIVPDMSHYQIGTPLAEEWLKDNTCSYIIFKATEGETYTDKKLVVLLDMFMNRHAALGSRSVTIGLYHFCRLDNKTGVQTAAERARAEMRNFFNVINTIIDYTSQQYGEFIPTIDIVPILDWEGESLKKSNRAEYLNTCVEECYKVFGTMPLLYCSASVTSSTECVAIKKAYPDIGLWVAHYNKNTPAVKTWTDWVAWQFTSTPFDLSFVTERFELYVVRYVDKCNLKTFLEGGRS